MRRGFLVKRMHGATIAEHNADVIYQPLSTLKLLGYLHALVDVDKGLSTMNTEVTWTEFLAGDDTENKCLKAGTPNTRTGSRRCATLCRPRCGSRTTAPSRPS